MPIRVQCPNGCLLRMPADRTGKKVRCPGCKAVIELPGVLDSELRSGKPIPLQATVVGRFEVISIENQKTEPPPTEPSTAAKAKYDRESGSGIGTLANTAAWRNRLQEANSNRIALTKALATLVLVVGVINAGPAIVHWSQSGSSIALVSTPRWVYLQVFLAALHFVYAVFLFQVADWSSLRAVSIAMLAFAFGFGIVSTALLIEGGHGLISILFSLPHSMVSKATIWAASMLCLATLVAYICGKEASDWKRAEQLLVEILNKSA